MIRVFKSSLVSDLQALLRNRAQWVNAILFFILLVSLFGVGLGFDNEQLIKISPAVIWVAFLLVSIFSIEALFKEEFEQGTLEQMLLSPYPLWWLMLAKSLAIWLVAAVPIILMVPLAGMFMQLSFSENMVLMLSVLLGSPALIFIGVIGAALTVSLPRSGLFLGLLLLPLYIPVLILGESAAMMLVVSERPLFQMGLLGAISMLCITLAPHAASAAIKISLN